MHDLDAQDIGWEIVQLGISTMHEYDTAVTMGVMLSVIEWGNRISLRRNFPEEVWGAFAYAVSKRGMRKLLESTRRCGWPPARVSWQLSEFDFRGMKKGVIYIVPNATSPSATWFSARPLFISGTDSSNIHAYQLTSRPDRTRSSKVYCTHKIEKRKDDIVRYERRVERNIQTIFSHSNLKFKLSFLTARSRSHSQNRTYRPRRGGISFSSDHVLHLHKVVQHEENHEVPEQAEPQQSTYSASPPGARPIALEPGLTTPRPISGSRRARGPRLGGPGPVPAPGFTRPAAVSRSTGAIPDGTIGHRLSNTT